MRHSPRRAAASSLFAALLACFYCVGAVAQQQPPAPRQGRGAQQQPPRRKKVPPGAKGFEQYAARDASDKLAVGAGTRGAACSLVDVGLERYLQNDLNGALSLFERAARACPDSAEAHYSLGIVLGELDRYEESASELRQALGCNPDDDQRLLATYNLGNAYLDLGKYAEALARFEESARLDPKQPTPHYNAGLAHVALKDLAKAAEAFDRALALKDDYTEARFNRALALWQSGRKGDARAEQARLRSLDAAQAARLDQLFR